MTIKNSYALPLNPDILNSMSGARTNISPSWTSDGDTTM